MTNDKNIITKTNDGYVVELFARVKNNIENEIGNLADGVSLLESNKVQTEEEQFSIYKDIADMMDESPVIIKTEDKTSDITKLKIQLRAILRAAKDGDLSIAFSKISSVTEIEELKEILEQCKNELKLEDVPYRKNIKVGAVVEIPSSALMSYELAKECDFLFIETDSLTSYTFGGQQNNLQIQKFQPVVIKLIQQAVEGAHDAGIFCGISGELVENEIYIPLLIGLGIDEFSIDSKKILRARQLISELDKSDCKELADEVINLRRIEDIEYKLKKFAKD